MHGRDDLFMATVGPDFEIGDFAKKSDKKSYLIWHIKEGGGSINSTPVIRGPHVYIAALDGYLYKVDKETGKLVWKFKSGGPFCDSYPVFRDGVIFLGSYDHNLYAIDEKTGEEVWRFKTGDTIFGSSGLLMEDMIIFTSKDFYVYALNIKTGDMIWNFRTGGWSASCPTEHEGNIIVSSSDGNLYYLTKEGKELWRFKTGGNIFTQNEFCVHEGVVYFGSDDSNIYGVRLSDGRETFRFKTGGYVDAVPIIRKGILYCISDENKFYAIELQNGRVVWTFKTGSGRGGSKPNIFGDRIVFGAADGNLYCLDIETGKEAWRYKTDGHIYGEPVIDNGRIYFGSYDCYLYCITKEGKLVWRFMTSTKKQTQYDYEEEAVFEFKAPEIEHVEEEKEDRYAVKTEIMLDDTYKDKSEYQTEIHYSSTGGEYK
ncbi:MAG: PQQ-binding-like beta-propeller repeat protein [Candidatus Aenigmarchaeota archaeon]|nr:PQQ-binding-like beta-propeller repeat protein [Candidatus Aenigmarchaeota archaeon]NIP41030.1 PQQ-binding-like beta-propeller repeat protein [Candidatus Aenigmarchaeota archaeon]NIQ17432.1 PQQ-binding-like beta-propeller repeat protein [Candidatus Aenigmarchaeota archaeon]NIS73626.1 PQQ-binding-like beta-propeller repeat protein [Candidatus Aenigmarchaeota archaeon]